MTDPRITETRSAMRAAQAAWDAARAAGDAEAVRTTARIAGRLEGEYRMAKMGRFVKSIPAGHVACPRCGGYGGSDAWPGFVCFECDGAGHVEA